MLLLKCLERISKFDFKNESNCVPVDGDNPGKRCVSRKTASSDCNLPTLESILYYTEYTY